MYVLRQRLLLVAGWLIAAIGAGLVASGAVAVAGGQVLDRPLRPLTAAEVAALPVAAVEVPEPVEPHASGGSPEDSGTSTVGSGDDADGRTGANGAGGSAAPRLEESPPEEPALDAFPEAGRAEVRVVAVEGGRASFAANRETVALLWATASPGHAAETRIAGATDITVTFSSAEGVWLVEAHLVDGQLEIRTEALPVA